MSGEVSGGSDDDVDVAVVVPVRDGAGILGDAIRSVETQTVQPRELIVVDDGSTDDTTRVARSAGVEPVPAVGRGVSAARNTGIARANSAYVAFLDADDIWPPTYLEDAAGVLARSAVDLLTADRIERDEQGKPLGRRRIDVADLTVEAMLDRTVHVTTSGVIARRDLLVAAGGFDPELPFGQDVALWLRLLHRGARVATTSTAVSYRVRDGQESLDRLAEVERSRARLLETLAIDLDLPHRLRRRARRTMALDVGRRYAKNGHRRPAARCVLLALPLPAAGVHLALLLVPATGVQALRRAARRRRRVPGVEDAEAVAT